MGHDAILIEAKRYSTRLSFAELILKLVEAFDRSGLRVEVWGAAATVQLNAAHAGHLRRYGEERGVTQLILDWTPLPRLAILLASARQATLEWFDRHRPSATGEVEVGLDAVRAHSAFAARGGALRREFEAGRWDWLTAPPQPRLDEGAVRRPGNGRSPMRLGAHPARPGDPTRSASAPGAGGLARWLHDSMADEPAVVAVIGAERANEPGLDGDERLGKTWAVATACLAIPDDAELSRPILLFMASHMWREGDEAAPMDLIARLIAEQTGVGPELDRDPGRWKAKLKRCLGV